MPFIKKAPRVSFRKPIGSVSVSGHKFIGAPVPCGVVITRQKVCVLHLPTRDHYAHIRKPLITDPILACVLVSSSSVCCSAVSKGGNGIVSC